MATDTQRQNKNALVTGGGGFLGQAIIKQLLEKQITVTSFSRNIYPELEALNVRQIQGDISDADAVSNNCRDMDVVFHTAAKAGVWGPYEDYHRTNVIGTQNIIEACKRHHVGRLVHCSSASVIYNGNDMEGLDETTPYPETYFTHYPKTKAMAEKMVVSAAGPDLRTIILRPHLIWGPGDNHLVPRILQRAKRLIQVGDGKNIADTIYIDNAAQAHILAADKLIDHPELSGKIYFISQDDKVPVWEMINNILIAGGKSPLKRKIPAYVAYGLGAVMEAIYRLFNIQSEPQMTRFVAKELSTSHWYDISAAKKDLGYSPTVTTAKGLEQLALWLKT